MNKFCTQCGSKINCNQRFCSSCGVVVGQTSKTEMISEQQTQNNPPSTVGQSENKQRTSKNILMLLLPVLIAFVLVLIGVRGILLNVIGEDVTAVITSHTRAKNPNDSRNPDPREFDVIYEFYVEGEKYSGKTTQIFKNGIKSTQTIPVRYMPNWPKINKARADTKITGGLLLIGLGGMLFVSVILGNKKSFRRKKVYNYQ
ncbi:MAG TPA: zinc ribbon domain-containing protein [Clostridia bacterium]|nr:zinc ribbon domain-containing protein [Clostridia bacterium]